MTSSGQDKPRISNPQMFLAGRESPQVRQGDGPHFNASEGRRWEGLIRSLAVVLFRS
jgi:hypothetical protein